MPASVFTTFVKNYKETSKENERDALLLQNINSRLKNTKDETEKNRLGNIANDFESGFIDTTEAVKQLRNKEQKQLTFTNRKQQSVDGNIVWVADVTPVDREKFVGYFDDARKQWLPVSSNKVKDIPTPKGIKIPGAPTKSELNEAIYSLEQLPSYSDLKIEDKEQAKRRFALIVKTLTTNKGVETREEAITKALNAIKSQITVEPRTFKMGLGPFSFDFEFLETTTLDKSPTPSFKILPEQAKEEEQPADKG